MNNIHIWWLTKVLILMLILNLFRIRQGGTLTIHVSLISTILTMAATIFGLQPWYVGTLYGNNNLYMQYISTLKKADGTPVDEIKNLFTKSVIRTKIQEIFGDNILTSETSLKG